MVCFLLGAIARRSGAFHADSHKVVTGWVLWVSLPSMVFRAIHGVAIDRTLLVGSSLLWLTFLIPAAVGALLVARGGDRQVIGATVLCAGLSNTAFVGLPLMEALGGREVLGPASVIDQLGSFVALFVFAIPFATWLGTGTVSLRQSVKKLTRSPGMVALALALVLRDVEVPGAIDAVLLRLADMLSPLGMALIGWQLDFGGVRGHARHLLVGLSWKLVLAPALVLALTWWWRGQFGQVERVIIAQSAMAPMVTAGVVAAENKLAPSLAAAFIAIGVPLSLVTVRLWWDGVT